MKTRARRPRDSCRRQPLLCTHTTKIPFLRLPPAGVSASPSAAVGFPLSNGLQTPGPRLSAINEGGWHRRGTSCARSLGRTSKTPSSYDAVTELASNTLARLPRHSTALEADRRLRGAARAALATSSVRCAATRIATCCHLWAPLEASFQQSTQTVSAHMLAKCSSVVFGSTI